MTIVVNGEDRNVAAGTRVGDVVAQLAPDAKGVAAAVNGQVVTRDAWNATVLADGDAVEILHAVAGGA